MGEKSSRRWGEDGEEGEEGEEGEKGEEGERLTETCVVVVNGSSQQDK